MAQKQYTTFQADILSFELRDALLGMLKPGRYMGYDTMAEYQAQAADNVYCRFTHPAGMDKYDQASPPVLEAKRGVAITTQGTIIAEDGNVDVTVTLINGGASDTVVHLLYMEHIYDGAVPGANNATYGIKSGTEGGGIPSLTSPTKQVVIGTIIEPAGATQFSNLVYHLGYSGLGDEDLYKTLFKSSALGEIAVGDMPSSNEGIIGNRNFTASNYLANWSTLTKALTDLDAAVKARADAITTLAGEQLDDWATPDDNEDLDATIAVHGLLKKLPNDAAKYLNGIGSWVVPVGGRFVMRTGAFGYEEELTDLSPDSNQLDFSSVASNDADVLILKIEVSMKSTYPSLNDFQWRIRVAASGGYSATFDTKNWSTGSGSVYRTFQVVVPCDSVQKLYANISSASKTYVNYIQFTCVGWQTYS